MTEYRSYRIIEGIPQWIIEDQNGIIIDKNPNKEKLSHAKINGNRQKYTDDTLIRCLRKFYEDHGRVPTIIDFDDDKNLPHHKSYYLHFGSWKNAIEKAGLKDYRNGYYNDKNICEYIKEDGKKCENILTTRNVLREKDKNGVWTGKWICKSCRDINDRKYNPYNLDNIKKSIANRRTGNQDPNHASSKGDLFEDLICTRKEWINLNKTKDNYELPIDCYDPISGLYHQVQGRFYNKMNKTWDFGDLEKEWNKDFHDMTCFCADNEMIIRKYTFPKKEIDIRKTIRIFNDEGKHWYDDYRNTDKDELDADSELFGHIIKRRS